jgi:rSAM/selenodomain-associated transferase 1
MKPVVVVFARAPRRGRVKRRLARDIGEGAAFRFYRAALRRTLWMLARERRFRTVVAVTPDHARGAWLCGLPAVPQGRGDLGQRMSRAMRRFRTGRVTIVGSDIPAMTGAHVRDALRLLGGADAVFGPAMDGGYWLVALGPRRPARPFGRVRWSGPHALADTLANFANRRVAFAQRLHDVDTGADLAVAFAAPA